MWAIRLDRRFGHVNAQLAQFADHARRAPGGIRAPHVLDEFTDVFGDDRTPWLTALTHASPVVAEPLFLPGDDGPRLHECQDLLPARPQAREPGPQESIGRPELRAPDTLLIDRYLVAQSNKFHLQRETRPEPGTDGGKKD